MTSQPRLAIKAFGVSTLGLLLAAATPPGASPEVPETLAPFEHLIGAWKGQGIPAANRIRGWPERHQWAWAFEKGEPVALALEMEGNKIIGKGRLLFDSATKSYRFEGTDPAKQPVAFSGKLDDAKQVLVLDRQGKLPDGSAQKLTVRLNTNKIRYTIWDDQKAEGAPAFKRATEMLMGKEGESLGGGDAADKGPKCIVTGGKATMTVSAGGKSFPVCCTGCRDEVEAYPDKYAKKLALRMAEPAKNTAKASASDDGSFDALLDGKEKTKAKPKTQAKKKSAPAAAEDDAPESKKPAAKPSDKAADLLERAQALEKSGKTDAAATYYRMIMKDHSGSTQAKTAKKRMEALGR